MSTNTPHDQSFETIEGLEIALQSDLPFGKQFVMGLAEYTIYDRAVEQGYHTGIQAHQDLLRYEKSHTPIMIDDEQFIAVINSFQLPSITDHDRGKARETYHTPV